MISSFILLLGDNMFYRYEIINNGKEDILYLYITMKYEFSNEFSLQNEVDLGRRTKNFIRTNQIHFKGNKVYLIVDGIVVKTLDMSLYKDDILKNDSYSSDQFMVHIRLDDNSMCEVSLREYLLSLLLSKYMDFLEDETLKAMCVLYNTYAYKTMKEDHFIFSTNPFAIYKPISYYKTSLPSYSQVIERLNRVITEVDCVFLTYQNDFILPFMHFSNNGKTLHNLKYPYLSSVKSLWDMASPYYVEIKDFSYKDISEKLNISMDSHSTIQMISKDNIKKVVFHHNTYTLEEIKTIFDLKSTDMYFIVNRDSLRIITKGWGNSYGLSIFGANEIVKNGVKYYNILNYYFPKTKLYRYIKELS